MVRGEHKLSIYERHAPPSIRYHLSIYDMHDTHLNELDNITKKYVQLSDPGYMKLQH